MPRLGEVLDSIFKKELSESEKMFYLYAFVYHVKRNSTMVMLELIRDYVEGDADAEDTTV